MYKITMSLCAFTTLAACSQDAETSTEALQLRHASSSLGLPSGPTVALDADPEADPKSDPNPEDGKDVEDDPEWQAAYVPGGAYWMQYGEVYTKPAGDDEIQAGRGEMVFAPNIGGVVQLWGFARVETNLQSLRLIGEISQTFDDGDCTESVSVFGEGFMISEDSFAMHIFEAITLEGKDCEAMGIGAPGVDEYEYLADFTYVPAPEQAEDGATNN